MVVTFITGNLKDFLMKELILSQRLIIALLHPETIMVQKQEYNLVKVV